MAPLLLLYCLLILSRNCVYSQELFLGKFRQILHDVGGKAYAISERVIEVREFEYDGQGPAVYFWLDKDMNPSSNGIGLTSPQNVPSCGMKIGLAATGSKTFTIELPEGQTLTCKFPLGKTCHSTIHLTACSICGWIAFRMV